MATFLDGRITEGVALFGRVAQLFADSGDLLRVVTPRSTRGHGLVFADRAADGLAETDGRAAAGPRARCARGAGVRAVAPLRGAVRAGPHRRGRAGRAGGAADRPRRRAPRLDGDRAPGAGDRPADRRGAGRGGPGVRRLGRRRRGRAHPLRVLGRGPLGAGRDRPGCAVAAEPLVRRALAIGPPLGQHEARLAEVELAAARGADDRRGAGRRRAGRRRSRTATPCSCPACDTCPPDDPPRVAPVRP